MKHSILALNLLVTLSIGAMDWPKEMQFTAIRTFPVLEDDVEVRTTVGKTLSLAVYTGARDTKSFCVPLEGYDTKVLRFLGSELWHINLVHETVVVRLLALQAGRTDLKLNFKCGLPGWEWDILGSVTLTVLVKE
jgi:hypothetical protein